MVGFDCFEGGCRGGLSEGKALNGGMISNARFGEAWMKVRHRNAVNATAIGALCHGERVI